MRVRTESKREEILEVAKAVFQELGYERASMSAIASRVGGSKATLYGYFPSKQELFLAVTEDTAGRHMSKALSDLTQEQGSLPLVLRRFGEDFLSFLVSEENVATYRMLVAEAGQSEIGGKFYEMGPRQVEDALTGMLTKARDAGQLKRDFDAKVAALHLLGLLDSEIRHRWLLSPGPKPSPLQLKSMVERAVTVFMAAYS